MTCDEARRLTSAAMDDPLPTGGAAPLEHHIAECPSCRAFAQELEQLRRNLRFEPVGVVPDVAPRVREALTHERTVRREARPRRSAMLAAAAVFLIAFVVGTAVGGITRPDPVMADNIGERILAAQAGVTSLSADVSILERGWHRDIPARRYRGTVRYEAPESLAVRLRDRTGYPSSEWVSNDVDLVVRNATAWSRSVRGCPPALQPGCSAAAETEVVQQRRPFDPGVPLPLDLVVPVRSFGLTKPAQFMGRRTIDGAAAIGVRATVAQIQPLLDGFTTVGNWRELYPADEAEVWLDERSLVPRRVSISPATGAQRERWAATRGYDDAPNDEIFSVSLTDIQVNTPVDRAVFSAPADGGRVVDAGFTDTADVEVPRPSWLPPGVKAHRTGVHRSVSTMTWSDGRAWLAITATRHWAGARLFGDLGEVVRLESLPAAGVAYVGGNGSVVALHGRDIDVAVSGSFPTATLLRVTSGLDLDGLPVPPGWQEHPVATMGSARRVMPGLLRVEALDGFASPAVRVEGDSVVLAYAGPGARGFVVVQEPGTALPPPMDADVQGLRVRGATGRFTARRGELEWIENGRRIVVRSETLQATELLHIAEHLGAAP